MQLPPEMWHTLLWNWLGMALLTAALSLVRFDQEQVGQNTINAESLAACVSRLD
jgi:hypothetical protein